MNYLRLSVLLLLAAAGVFLTGCKPPCPSTVVSLEHLIGEYNANAARVPRLWARAKIAAVVKDKNGMLLPWGSTSPLAQPNGYILLTKGSVELGPHNFLLLGREGSVEVFRLGSSVVEGLYYFTFGSGGAGRGWIGRHEFAGAEAVTDLPVDPIGLLTVLSICELPIDFTQIPTVTLRMSTEPCAYVVSYIDRDPISRKIRSRREIYFNWSDKEPRRPFKINFFDNTGRQVMVAKLRRYKPVAPGEEEENPADSPLMPTDIEISWPEKGSSIHIVLSEMTATKKGTDEVFLILNKLTEIPGDNVIMVDRHCYRGGRVK